MVGLIASSIPAFPEDTVATSVETMVGPLNSITMIAKPVDAQTFRR